MASVQFSVVIICYNHRNFIRDCVDSVLSQDHAPLEVIVVDDASPDDSAAVLETYGGAIRLIRHQSNQGISRTRNDGGAEARGDYIVFLDGDDALKPGALRLYDTVIASCQAPILLAALHWFRESVPKTDLQDLPREVQFVCYDYTAQKDRTWRCSGSAIVVERRAYHKLPGWNESLRLMADHDMVRQFALASPAVQILAPATVFYRDHPYNASKSLPGMRADAYQMIAEGNQRIAQHTLRPWSPEGVLIGGPVFFVVGRALKAGFYRDGFKLLLHGWRWVAIASLARLRAKLRGPRASQTIAVSPEVVTTSALPLPPLK